MPTFTCFLNCTDQGGKALRDAPKRYEATKALVTRMGGRLVSAYVTTGQYDVVLVAEMPAILDALRILARSPEAAWVRAEG